MKFQRFYDIEIIKLNEGEHIFTFKIGDAFFEHFEENDFVKQGDLTATVYVNKLSSLIETDFDIKGTVKIICDRSLEEFDYPLSTSDRILYKYGSEVKEINEDIIMITRDTPKINVAQLIYEFILLAIPAKKIHPDYMDKIDEEDFEGEGEVIYTSEKTGEEGGNPEPSIDPRWEELKKLNKKD